MTDAKLSEIKARKWYSGDDVPELVEEVERLSEENTKLWTIVSRLANNPAHGHPLEAMILAARAMLEYKR